MNQDTRTGDDVLDLFDTTQSIRPSEGALQSAKLILDRWELTHEEFSKLIDENPSLRGVTLGYVAEWKFHQMFLRHPEVAEVRKDDDHNRKRKGDRTFRYKGHEFIVEVKSLQTNMVKRGDDGTWSGKSQVDASDKRQVTFKDNSTLQTTCLLRGEFDILAVNCYAFGNKWQFAFARNDQLPQNTFKKYTEAQRLALLPTLIPVTWPPKAPFYEEPFTLLDALVREREAGLAPEVPDVPVESVGA